MPQLQRLFIRGVCVRRSLKSPPHSWKRRDVVTSYISFLFDAVARLYVYAPLWRMNTSFLVEYIIKMPIPKHNNKWIVANTFKNSLLIFFRIKKIACCVTFQVSVMEKFHSLKVIDCSQKWGSCYSSALTSINNIPWNYLQLKSRSIL
jgi:hypothetical protein